MSSTVVVAIGGRNAHDCVYEGLHFRPRNPASLALKTEHGVRTNEAGILVRRSRETLEQEIERFTVVERDGMVIGCAGLEAFSPENVGELYCLAVLSRYREAGRGEALVEYIAERARAMGRWR